MKLREIQFRAYCCLLAAFLVLACAFNAYSYNLHFDHLTIDQGLSQNSVFCIIKDDIGFIWIGTTAGLNRYDGYTFTVYEPDVDNPNSLSNGYVLAMCEDHSGALWIGTENGLNRFNPGTNQFTRYLHNPADSKSISSNRIFTICEDNSGGLWIGTENGLNKFNQQTNQFTCYQISDTISNDVTGKKIRSVYLDRSDLLWIGTEDAGLYTFDRNKEQFTRYSNVTENPSSINCKSIRCIYEDDEKIIWIGSDGDGLYSIDRGKNVIINYSNNPKDSTTLSDNVVNAVYEDRSGVLWIATDNGGVNIFDRQSKTFFRYQNNLDKPASLSCNRVTSICDDGNNGMWFGAFPDGINKTNIRKLKFTHYKHNRNDANSLSDNQIWEIIEGHDSIIWIGTDDGGLNKFDPQKNRFTHFKHKSYDRNSLSHNRVNTIYEDTSGVLWVGTNGGGLNKFDPERERFVRYTHDPNDSQSISSNRVIGQIMEDRYGFLWIGTKGGGLNRFNRKTEKFTHYRFDPDDPYSLSDDRVYYLFEDRFGVFWVATFNGLNKFDREKELFTRYYSDPRVSDCISHNMVLSLHEDKQGNLWMATYGGGLNKYNREKDNFTHFTKKDGLPDNGIYDILEDDRGNLWISSNNGISKFNPGSGRFKNYYASDGLQSDEFNNGAACKSISGKMFFGGINGISAFYPDSIQDNQNIPPVVITDFQLFNRPVPIGKMTDGRTILNKSITATSEIILSYRDNVFSFEFAALNYLTPENNQYAYILEGFEKEWNYVENKRFVTYTSLDPGKYVFRVKGSNNDGLWNEEGTSLQITIIPPYWETIWFKMIVALIILCLLAYLYLLNAKRITHKMEKNQWEKELKLKADFTAMLVHDLRNPMQGIMGYSELLIKKSEGNNNVERAGRVISESANSMIALINDMLDVYKFEANKMVIKKEEIILGTLLYDVTLLVKPLLSKNNISYEQHIEVNDKINADPNRIIRVINNLLSNAIKFSPEKGIITVSVTQVQIQDRWYQELAVTDQGPGIEESKQKHLFNAYAQLEDKSGNLSKGTGLGLAVSKMIIEAHDGIIGYQPGKNGGSEFYFCLPAG